MGCIEAIYGLIGLKGLKKIRFRLMSANEQSCKSGMARITLQPPVSILKIILAKNTHFVRRFIENATKLNIQC